MADHTHHGDFEGQPWELARYITGDGEIHDLTYGDPPPGPDDWGDIEMVTVNLRPDLDEGMYRNYFTPGFTDDYTLEDLVYEAMASYGMVSGE